MTHNSLRISARIPRTWGILLFRSTTIEIDRYDGVLPYLPVYNAHPCIMRTLIFATFFFEKKKTFLASFQQLIT